MTVNRKDIRLDPYEGGKLMVVEAALDLACAGAVPLGAASKLESCVNAAEPTVQMRPPEIAWQWREQAARGITEACREFRMSLAGLSANPSDQAPNSPIDLTPTLVMAGLIERPEHLTTPWFKDEGDAILLLGSLLDGSDPLLGLGGSACLRQIHGLDTVCRLGAAWSRKRNCNWFCGR